MDTREIQMKRLPAFLIRRLCVLAVACELVVALTAPPAHAQPCAPPPPGLMGWWPLNETAGTAVADALGQNSGTASGTVGPNGNPKSVPGLVGTGLNFY